MIPITALGILAVAFSAVHAAPLSEEAVQAAARRLDHVLTKARTEEKKLAARYGPQPDLPADAGDATFLRRACIDLAGRLPAAEEVNQFIADTAPDKRARLTDRLLAEPGAAEVRFRALAEALRIQDDVDGEPQAPFIAWLREAMKEDRPYHELVAAMLRARGRVATTPAAGLMQRDSGDLLHTSTEVARAFLGADLHCAHCHDHPYDDWTQRQSYEFAGCFATQAGNGPTLPPRYLYADGKPGDKVPPRYLPFTKLEPNDPQNAFVTAPDVSRDLRDQLALWFTGPQNTRFAEMGGLRLWHLLFGLHPKAGRYHEVAAEQEAWHDVVTRHGCDTPPTWNLAWFHDDFDPTQPAYSLVQALGEEFQKCGYRQREFLRILARTHAYQREAMGDASRTGLPAAPRLRRLPPHVTWDAWAHWLPGARSSPELPQVPEAGHPLRVLGQGRREWADETVPAISHGLTRFMMTSPLIERVAASSPLPTPEEGPDRTVEHLFLRTLGRLPETREKSAALQHLHQHPQTGSQDILWALLNTSEFMFVP